MIPGCLIRPEPSETISGMSFNLSRRLHIFKKRSPAPGSAPGAFVTSTDAREPKLKVLCYGEEQVDVYESPAVEDLPSLVGSRSVTWIDVQGLGTGELIRRIAEVFSLHELAVEDVFHVPQRPKAELYNSEYMFVVCRVPTLDESTLVQLPQLSIFLGKGWVLTFQENYDQSCEPVKRRVRSGKDPIQKQGADYLAYAIVDSVVDTYFPVLDGLGDQLAELEEEALNRPDTDTLRRTNTVRGALLAVRRVLWPQKEAVHALIRDRSGLVSDTVKVYLRDTEDHCSQVSDVVDSYREIVSGVSQTWLSSNGNRTNDVMKVLTIMASIFIPLNFLAAVYGMNFEYMPELRVPWAYPALLGVMTGMVVGMLALFYRKGWFSSEPAGGSKDQGE